MDKVLQYLGAQLKQYSFKLSKKYLSIADCEK